ncbi:FAD-dependent thymidylate synthase [Candidatus Bipolaricaulota bacterium]|nr:FAD-dependent thymidylate synthase [Candidatus Bipolaricaulota bacterium]
MRVELLFITPEAENLIARCARISHKSVGKGPEDDRRLIRKLIKLGHESVLEHAHATFEISGISRACANQLTRHRLASFVQESQRYVEVQENELVRPPTFSEEDWERAKKLFQEAMDLYRFLLGKGVPKEDARFVLPLGIETRLVLTANFRELRHILRLRLSPAAQWEIREVAKRMWEILYAHAPSCFEDLSPLAKEPEGKEGRC